MNQRNREELTLKLVKYFDSIGKTARNSLVQDMLPKLGKIIGPGKVTKIVTDSFVIGTIEDYELYIITKFVKDWTYSGDMKNEYAYKLKIEPLAHYFSDEDIEAANNLGELNDNNRIFKMKALQKGTVDNPEWIGVLSYKDIVDMNRNGMLRYNMDTQRSANSFVSKGRTYYLPDINHKTIEGIKNAILNDDFISNTITLNILKDTSGTFNNTTESENILTINTDYHNIDIIDGMHRIKGIVAAWVERERQIREGIEKKQIEGTMSVCVKNLTVEQAQKFIYQESLANLQQEKTISMYEPDSFFMNLITKISGNTNKNNPYKGIDRSGYDGDMSLALIISFINDMNIKKDIADDIDKKLIGRIAADLVETSEIIISDLVEKDEKHEYVYKSQCFKLGLIAFYLSHVRIKKKEFIEMSEKTRDNFVSVIEKMVNKESIFFEYPFKSNKEKDRIRRLFIERLTKDGDFR